MKLTELQIYKMDQALSNSQSVLAQIRQKELRGDNLAQMKMLEEAVTNLEIFRINIELKD